VRVLAVALSPFAPVMVVCDASEDSTEVGVCASLYVVASEKAFVVLGLVFP
jgi:hypothetical protein